MGNIEDILNHNLNKLNPKVGRVLISSPSLIDMYFRKSLVLITEQAEDSTVGYILNKYSGVTLDSIVTDFKVPNIEVFIGGPVGQDMLNFIHSNPKIDDCLKICDGIYWGGDFEHIEKLMIAGELKADQIKFFVGYCGWVPDQLKEELTSRTWIVLEENSVPNMLSKDCDWDDVVDNLDDSYKLWKNYPEDPFMN